MDQATTAAALAKLERRKSQSPGERDGYTAAEARALMDYADALLRAKRKDGLPTRRDRSARNKALWRAGDRRQWGGEDRSK